ncbi:MAG: glycosyltransferase [Hyphomicrobium sp.]
MIDKWAQSPAGARICILTPGQVGSNPRVVKEAQALHEAGFDVTVIATRVLDLVESRDQAVLRKAPWRLQRIDLRPSIWWRALRAEQMVSRKVFEIFERPQLADRGCSAVTPPLIYAAVNRPADLYIAHYPAALPAAAAAAARHHGARYAYDAEDFHFGDWPDKPEFEIERRLVRSIEERYLPGCAYVTAASPGIAGAYAETYSIARPKVILNVFPIAEAPAVATVKGWAEPGPSVYWFSQTIGPDRGLECAVRAIGMADSKPHLYLRGTPVDNFVAALQAIAKIAGADGRLHILAPEAPDKMERLAACFDVGLVSETGHSRNRDICLTNKLFTFLLAGLPAILSATPAHRAFAAEADLGDVTYPIDDARALAKVIDGLLSDPERLAAARTNAFKLGRERYNWDAHKAALVGEVRCAMAWASDHGST